MKNNLLIGMGYFLRGFTMLNTPGLRRYVWLPVLVNLVLLTLGVYWVFNLVTGMEWLQDGSWAWLAWILVPVALLLSTLVSGYFFTAILLLLASPFYGMLAGRIEQMHGIHVEEESLRSLILRTLGRELVKMKYYLPWYIILLVIPWLMPLLIPVMPFVWFAFGSWVMSLQYSDYTLDNHQLNFRDTKAAVASTRWTALGFGATVSLVMAIPVLNCLVPPAAVIGATLWQLERQYPQARLS
ncbi:sulfate transporter CysZ [Oceanobacter mangrovi]|uniref:sulfate transporter CysZ n=1 Tax=Oceanobacter mangrovi TaxID=2862510 RepID=UPI001C8D9A96|nr:sulfate transporter CysZ [Oceanobacter mangrovi]